MIKVSWGTAGFLLANKFLKVSLDDGLEGNKSRSVTRSPAVFESNQLAFFPFLAFFLSAAICSP